MKKRKVFSSNVQKLLFFTVLSLIFLIGCGNDASTEDEASGSGNSDNVNIDYASFKPSTHQHEIELFPEYFNEIEEQTEGRLTITTYLGESLAAADDTYDATANGAVDMGVSLQSYSADQFPLTSVLDLPYVTDSGEKASEILWTLFEEFPEFQDEYDETVPLILYGTEPYQIATADQPIQSLEDIEGMRIRSPSPEVSNWLEYLGATPVNMPVTELYEALERGTVDGSILPMHTLTDWSLEGVVDYVTVGNFFSAQLFMVMNREVYESLSEEDREVIDSLSGLEMSKKAGALFDGTSEEAMAEFEEEIDFYELDEEESEEWRSAIEPAVDDWIDRMTENGFPAQEIYDRALEIDNELD
ncbi:TRAP transporter substrate-binding protein [Salicibibacter kimchii]|uniref:TRAP transporter substrate-binding protein n=1 Tax=Salicibibacter kimchii TaxID=2099786 RepID=A0A345BW74_9BACI|nr:TRAP transporter substrate-binding protein [Salicibibacter kimchii]AXF55205.1 TRAP transporter substrate-binding protein [Salicibibacter kimchii]